MVLPPGPVGLKFWQPRVETTEANWFTLYSVTPFNDTNGWGANTLRTTIATSAYDSGAPATATKIRVTFQAGGALSGAAWDKAYIGHAAASGDAYDFDGSQVQLLWSGSSGGSLGAAAAALTSDAVVYAFDKTRPLVVSMHFLGAINTQSLKTIFSGAPAGFSQNALDGDDAATTDTTGYTTVAGRPTGFPKIEVYFEAVTDSGPVTLPAAGGSYTLTGSDAGLGLGYWLTGSDVTFATASSGTTTLTADAGSYALTGSAAALSYSATLTAGAGSYALTGSAIGLGLGYWLTGSDVTFTTAPAGGTTLTAAAGSYTLTGSSAALALRHTAGAGSYSLTGTAAAYRLTLAAGAGSYTLSGSPATFATPFKLPAAGGAYTLTGFDAALTVISGVVLFCGSGSYTLTGSDAALPPLVTEPVPPTDNYTGGGVRRIRKYERKRKREELEELLDAIGVTPPEIPATPPAPKAPPAPGLMADVPTPARTVLRSPPDEDEDEIALLLELLS